MNIGIITFHFSNNYGGVLQAYSLQKYLESLGHNVYIVDYIPIDYKNGSVLRATGLRLKFWKTDLKDLSPSLLFYRLRNKMKYNKSIINKFESFRNGSMKLTSRITKDNMANIMDEFHLMIVGSDQVWSPFRRYDYFYQLNFPNYKGLKMSYAADSSNGDVNNKDVELLKHSLLSIDYLTVRNEYTQNFVEKICGEVPTVVVDPTLLIDFNLLDLPSVNDMCKSFNYDFTKDFIFIYTLGDEICGGIENSISKIKSVYGMIQVVVATIPTTKFSKILFADKVLFNCGPLEWLYLIKNAKVVLTDSYHATLFSIQFETTFIAYYKEQIRAGRFLHLAEHYGLENNIITKSEEVLSVLENKTDFKKVKDLLNKHIEESRDYLGKYF